MDNESARLPGDYQIEARRLEMRRILQEAEALGMTYGKYVSYLESKKRRDTF